ncbi:MAG: CxxC-x17-CxxC domain-containing protein [Candidatus Woesearchaeota archaeon]
MNVFNLNNHKPRGRSAVRTRRSSSRSGSRSGSRSVRFRTEDSDKPNSRDFDMSDRRRSENSDNDRSRRFRSRDSDESRNFRSSRDSRRGRDYRGKDKLEMHSVICDKCGVKCEVPFKPTSSKPIFCSDCFRKNDDSGRFNSGSRLNSGSKSNADGSKLDFDKINQKLDKIMKALDID